jgi:hypothetical protein
MNYRLPIDSQQWNAHLLHKRTCQVCGQPYLGHNLDEEIAPFYCSVTCRTEAKRLRRVAARVPKKPIRCAECSERFMPQRSTARFCSTRCRVAAHRAVELTP